MSVAFLQIRIKQYLFYQRRHSGIRFDGEGDGDFTAADGHFDWSGSFRFDSSHDLRALEAFLSSSRLSC